MEWTREQRYQKLKDADQDQLKKLEIQVSQSIYRQSFHIQPKSGLLNDPNGFIYYEGAYHLFYQWFPLGPVHGIKYWYHLKSKDLMTWEDLGVALAPEYDYESHGVFSGTALIVDGLLHLYYTGFKRDQNGFSIPSQSMAMMDKRNRIFKTRVPLIIKNPDGYTEHVRNPKVWQDQDGYWMMLGAQRNDLTGTAIIYHSDDTQNWTLKQEFKTQYQKFGYMWECPDYFSLDDKQVFIFSPKGLRDYANIYQAGYLLGDLQTSVLDDFSHDTFKELDHGFDFYAPQTTTHKGERILMGWMGLPEIKYPSDKDGWAHCLTLPRILSIENNQLIQRPHPNLIKLRKKTITDNLLSAPFEIIITINKKDNIEVNLKDPDNSLKMSYKNEIFTLDRSQFGAQYATEYGQTRSVKLKNRLTQVRLFVDRSSIEIFINDGEAVMSMRYFTQNNQFKLSSNEAHCIKLWQL